MERFNVSFDADLKKTMDADAASREMERSQWLRMVVREFLRNDPAKDEARVRVRELEALVTMWKERHADAQGEIAELHRRLDTALTTTDRLTLALTPAEPERRPWWKFGMGKG